MKDREIKSCTQRTVWVDLHKRLPILAKVSEEDAELLKQIQPILEKNKEEWASKGWEAANKLYGNPKQRVKK